MVNKQRLINLTKKLISIDSQNPPGDEAKIGAFVAKRLLDLGLPSRTYEFKKRRTNVVALWEGRDKNYSLLLTPHLDTVPSGRSWRHDPFRGLIHNNRMYGLGATDCKGNLACALEVLRSLIEDKIVLNYSVLFAATADEETGSSLGLIPLIEKGILRPQEAVVLDADDFNIVVTQKGLIHLKVKIEGKRAHGAYPWRGINAIDRAIDIIRDLKKHKFSYPKNEYLRAPTMNVGTIRGGDKVNVVADWCEFELDFRFLPGMSAQSVLNVVKNKITRHAPRFKIEIEGIQKPYRIRKDHPLVECLTQAMKKHHVKPIIKGSEGATVITFFQDKHIPALATGFGCEGRAHSADEYVSIPNLYKGAQVLEEFLKSYRACDD